MILDTSFIIDVMKKNEKAMEKLKEIISAGDTQIITAPTIFELYSGVLQSDKPDEEKHRILYTLSHMVSWHLDPSGAERGGEINGKLIKAGEQIDAIDCMIAGIALTCGEKILTRNVKHFSRILGLKVETY